MEFTADQDAGLVRDALELATWTRQRSSEELRSFVLTRHAQLPDSIDIE